MTNQQLNYLSVVSVVSVSISAWKLPRKFWCFIFKYCWRLSFMILLLTMYNTWGPKWMAMPLPLKRKSVNVRVLCSSLAKCRLPSWGKNTLRWGSWIQWIPPYSSYRNCLVSTNMSDLLVNESIVKLENDSSLGGLISENKVWEPPSWFYFSPASTRLNLNSADAVGRDKYWCTVNRTFHRANPSTLKHFIRQFFDVPIVSYGLWDSGSYKKNKKKSFLSLF